MPDETTPGSSASPGFDPIGMWRQWYDNAATVWSNTLGGAKEAYADPFGIYRQWLKSTDEHQPRGEPASPPKMDPVKLWKEWFDATSAMWRTSAGARPADPLGLTTQWLEMMEETRAKMLSKEGLPLDPLSFLREWYDRTSEIWSTVIGDTIGTDAFIESASRYMESYTSYYKSLRQTAETQLHNLQIPTRSDVARVAGLVVALEDKVDRLEDAFEGFADQHAHSDAMDSVTAIEERISRIETKLETLLAAVEKLGANGRGAAAPRHERVREQAVNGKTPSQRTPARRTRRASPRAAGESAG